MPLFTFNQEYLESDSKPEYRTTVIANIRPSIKVKPTGDTTSRVYRPFFCGYHTPIVIAMYDRYDCVIGTTKLFWQDHPAWASCEAPLLSKAVGELAVVTRS